MSQKTITKRKTDFPVPVRVVVESTDTDFMIAFIRWIDSYPSVKEGTTTVKFCGTQSTEAAQ